MIDFNSHAQTWDANAAHAARTAAISAAMAAKLPLSKTQRALEVGCGTGLLGLALQESLGSILFTDSSTGMIEVLDRKIADGGWKHLETKVLDLAKDPAPDGPFDLAFSQMALHHIPDVLGHFRTLFGLLAPGGHLAIADLDKEDGSFHGEGVHVHHGFDRDVLRQQAAEAGFEAISFDTVYQMPREMDGAIRHFPIFLLTARKPG